MILIVCSSTNNENPIALSQCTFAGPKLGEIVLARLKWDKSPRGYLLSNCAVWICFLLC